MKQNFFKKSTESTRFHISRTRHSTGFKFDSFTVNEQNIFEETATLALGATVIGPVGEAVAVAESPVSIDNNITSFAFKTATAETISRIRRLTAGRLEIFRGGKCFTLMNRRVH